jgi:hypothetical protein
VAECGRVSSHALNDSVSDYGTSARYATPNEALDMMDDTQELTPSWKWLQIKTTVTPSYLVYRYQGSGNTCWFHLHERRVSARFLISNFCHVWMLYAFSWVIPLCLNFICQHFGRLCLSHFHRRVDMNNSAMKMELTVCSKMLAYTRENQKVKAKNI